MSKRSTRNIPPVPQDPAILNPIAIPDKLFATPAEVCEALQISRLTLWTWTKRILAGDAESYKIRPIVFSRRKDGTPSTVRYAVDSLGVYPGTFLSRYRKARRAEAAAWRKQERAMVKAATAVAGASND